jgi:hypothetical protein
MDIPSKCGLNMPANLQIFLDFDQRITKKQKEQI